MRLLLACRGHSFGKQVCNLLKHNDCAIDVVETVENAVSYLQSEEYDCAIIGTRLADGDGLRVLKEIRDEGLALPVMIISAEADSEQEVRALSAGADEYLAENTDPQVLIARLNAIRRRGVSDRCSMLRFEGIILDHAAYSIRCSDRSIRLVNKEFQIMEYLLLNLHRFISTKELMENIWGYDNDEDYSVVWTCISALRSKLRSIDAGVVIKLNRGAGYHLETEKDPSTCE